MTVPFNILDTRVGDRVLDGNAVNGLLGATQAVVVLNAIGAATVTGAGIAAGLTSRTGATAAAADTTDTAANIVAALPIGAAASWEYVYQNNTGFPITLGGGTGVTLTSIVIPARSWVRFLVTKNSAAAVTLLKEEAGYFPTKGTFVANGTSAVTITDANVTALSVVSFGLNTVGGTPAGAPYVATSTPGTGMTVKAAAGDTSTYNYEIRG